MCIKVVQTFAVLSRKADRFAKTQRIGLDHTSICCRAFTFIRGQDHVIGFLTQNFCKNLVRRRHPDACVDHEQANIGHFHGPFCQLTHATLKGFIGRFFQTSGVDYGKTQIGKTCCTFTQVASHPWLVIDQSQTFTN